METNNNPHKQYLRYYNVHVVLRLNNIIKIKYLPMVIKYSLMI